MKKEFLKILLPLLFTVIISFIFVRFGKIDYEMLNQPKFAPKPFVFSIAWSIIYILMYFSMIPFKDNKKILFLYYCVLLSHILWNLLFFFLGYFLIGLLVLVIIYLISWVFVYFLYDNKKSSFWLNAPYMLWLLIALYLNLGVVLLN